MPKLKSIHGASGAGRPVQLTAAQLASLASDPRRAIVETLANGEPRSLRELAQGLGRSAAATHRHLAILKDEGLIADAGARPSRRRPERLYRLVATSLSSETASRSAEGRAALAQAGRKIAAASGRDFARLAADPVVPLVGADRRAVVRRTRLRLSAAGLARLNAAIDALFDDARSEGDMNAPGFDVGLTLILA